MADTQADSPADRPGFHFVKVRLKPGDRVIPVARSGHRIVYYEADGCIYSLGGYNPDFRNEPNRTEDTNFPLFLELWIFNVARRQWFLPRVTGRMPKELASHSLLLYRGKLLTYGGSGVPFGESNNDSLDCCDLSTLTWTRIETSGDKPIGKYGHTMTQVGNSLVLFGGTTGYVYNTDIHLLNLSNFTWELLANESNFDPAGRNDILLHRYRHEVCTDNENLYILGGGTSSHVFGFNEIAAFNFQERKWFVISTHPDRKFGFPAARRCHSCVQFQNCGYICGGLDGAKIYGDVWKFDMATLTWTKLLAELERPVYFHSATVTEAGCMYVFGGVVQLDVERTNKLYKLWLVVPSLKERAWEQLCDSIKWDGMTTKQALEIGIPQEYVEKLGLLS